MGPAELTSTDSRQTGVPIDTQADLDHWMSIQDSRDRDEPFTFIVDLDGRLRVAARRTEHVECAAGRDVLAAAEVQFAQRRAGWIVEEISNQSAPPALELQRRARRPPAKPGDVSDHSSDNVGRG